MQKWNVVGESRVGVFANMDITAGTELTFDYQLESVSSARMKYVVTHLFHFLFHPIFPLPFVVQWCTTMNESASRKCVWRVSGHETGPGFSGFGPKPEITGLTIGALRKKT